MSNTHKIPLLPLHQSNLEPLKVARLLSLLPGGELLGPRRSRPLGGDLGLLKGLPDDTGTGGSGEGSDGVRGEDDVTVGDGLTRDRGVGSVNESLVGSSIDSVRQHEAQDWLRGERASHSPCCGQ